MFEISVSDFSMSETGEKQYPCTFSCGPRGGDSVLPVMKTFNWQCNLFYCYIHLYSIHLSLLCKHGSSHNDKH
jgi:hypothetical protein